MVFLVFLYLQQFLSNCDLKTGPFFFNHPVYRGAAPVRERAPDSEQCVKKSELAQSFFDLGPHS